MKGRIKAGEGTLIGNAGESYVLGELLKRGIVAGLTPRNTRAFDILAKKNNKFVGIRVKTKSHEYREWQYSFKKDRSIHLELSKNGDFTILVTLSMQIKDMKFFIVPTIQIDKWLREGFKKWVETPGKNNRPHNPENKKVHLLEDKHATELEKKYLNAWDTLFK